MDIGTAKPTPAEQAEVPHHLLDLAEPDRRLHRRRVPGGAGRRPGRDRGPGPPRPPGRAAPALYLRAVVDGLDPPRPVPRGPGRAGGRARHRRAPRAAWRRSTRWRPPAWSPPTAGGWCGRSRSRSAAAGPSRLTGPGLEALSADAVPSGRAVAAPGRSSAARIRARLRAPGGRRASSTRSTPCWPARPGCPAPPVRPWATASCSATSKRRLAGRRRRPPRSAARRGSPGGSGRGSGATPASSGSVIAENPLAAPRRPSCETGGDHAPPAHQAPRPGQRLPRAPGPPAHPRRGRRTWRGPSATGPPGSGPTA